MNQIATPLLYRHLVLPTPEAGRALLRRLRSKRWRDGKRAGEAAGWVTQVTIGCVEGSKRLLSGNEVGKLVQSLKRVGVAVERVRVAGARLGSAALRRLKDVEHLQLDGVVVILPAQQLVSLARLTHLSLVNTHTHTPDDPSASHAGNAFLSRSRFPSLTHAALYSDNYGSTSTSTSTPRVWACPPHLAGQLECIAVREDEASCAHQILWHARAMTRLRELQVAVGQVFVRPFGDWPRFLHELPHSLAKLDLTGGPVARAYVDSLADRFVEGSAAVGALETLRLPRAGDVVCAERDGGEDAAALLLRVAALAEARGAVVEWD